MLEREVREIATEKRNDESDAEEVKPQHSFRKERVASIQPDKRTTDAEQDENRMGLGEPRRVSDQVCRDVRQAIERRQVAVARPGRRAVEHGVGGCGQENAGQNANGERTESSHACDGIERPTEQHVRTHSGCDRKQIGPNQNRDRSDQTSAERCPRTWVERRDGMSGD